MAEGETRSGLLSKVAKFVRNPTKDWSELDQKESEPDSGYSKEVLKEMIERKRQNDFVRKREFDHLRKLRRREPIPEAAQAGRPSFFQSSLNTNQDDRAETLKKIDEIEAQMSRQWWKGKQGEDGRGAAGFPISAKLALQTDAGLTQPPADVPLRESAVSAQGDSRFEPTAASALQPHSSHWTDSPVMEYPPTVPAEALPTVPWPMLAGEPVPPMGWPVDRVQPAQAIPMQPMSAHVPLGAGFSTSRLYAAEPADSLTDPDLEEAAIRFANGDDTGAEESLLSALQGDHVRPELAEAWMSALFDLYRATGQQARFDNVALEFASRFGRSAPAWFSTPDLLARQASEPAKRGRARSAAANAEPDWACPSQLTAAALTELQGELQGGRGPIVLDWQSLAVIGPDAVPGLARLVAGWGVSSASLVFRGYESLNCALKALTLSGERTVNPVCWQLRMDALRVMRLQDEFELVALEYCVTYEVSPPSWQEARCSCELQGGLGGLGGPAAADDARSNWDDPSLGLTSPIGLDGQPPAVVELAGEIVGDAADVLARLEAGMDGATRMVVSCARLIRVDFSAAGSILNWVVSQQANGCQVQFREVNRIVAAFFAVIGINEHARVVPRAA